jgi:hypothetical protein
MHTVRFMVLWTVVQDPQGRRQPPPSGAPGKRGAAGAGASGTLEPHPGATQPWQPPAQQQQQASQPQQQQQQQRSMINVREIQRAVPAGGVIELLVPSAGGVTGVVYTLLASAGNQVSTSVCCHLHSCRLVCCSAAVGMRALCRKTSL